jgi:omega-amidase
LKVLIAQYKPSLSKKKNLKKHLEILEETPKDTDVVIFPELSLNGYYLQDKVVEDFWTIEELDEIADVSKDFDIIVGAVLKDGKNFYNTAIYFWGGKVLHIHRKFKLPNYGLFEESRFFAKGDLINSFHSPFGKSVMLVCEDLWSGETIGKLETVDPDMIFVLSNSPTRGFTDDGNLEIVSQWRSILKTTAILVKSKIIFVNRVGFEDGLGFWGGSRIISENGETLQKLELFKETLQTFENL